MKFTNLRFIKLGSLMAAFLFTFFTSGAVLAGQVTSGYDLLHTLSPTYISYPGGVINFHGVPIGNHDFGGAIGVKDVGNADTIVQRLADVDTDGGTTGIAIKALQLVSNDLFDFSLLGGSGSSYIYATLANNPTPDLTGAPENGLVRNTMRIGGADIGSGTFTSYLDFYVDFYQSPNADGSGGVLVNNLFNGLGTAAPIEKILLGSGPWSNTPNAPTLINGVNHKLDGTGTLFDFYTGTTIHYAPDGSIVHSVPEASTFYLLTIAFGLLGYSRRNTFYRPTQMAA